MPEWASELDQLTPFAVRFRYDTIGLVVYLIRRQVRDLVVRIYNWAASIAQARKYEEQAPQGT